MCFSVFQGEPGLRRDKLRHLSLGLCERYRRVIHGQLGGHHVSYLGHHFLAGVPVHAGHHPHGGILRCQRVSGELRVCDFRVPGPVLVTVCVTDV